MGKYKDIHTGKEYENIPEDKVLPIIIKGIPVTEEVYDTYSNNNPKELSEIVITPHKTKTNLDELTESNFIRSVLRNKEDERIRNANYWEGIGNVLSFSQWLGAFINAYQGEDNFASNLWYGNSGYLPDKFALKYPRATILLNMLGDAALGYGVNKGIRYINTPIEYQSGAETNRVYRPNRLSRYVYKEMEADPSSINLKNQVPEAVPHEYVGTTSDGLHIYKLKLAYSVPDNLNPTKLRKMFLKMIHSHKGFNYGILDSGMLDFVNSSIGVTDLGVGNIGEYWSGKLFPKRVYKIIDPGVLSISEYNELYMKQGGKLILKNGNNNSR